MENEGGTESSDRGCRRYKRDADRARTNEAGSRSERGEQRDRIRGRRKYLCLAGVRGLKREKPRKSARYYGEKKRGERERVREKSRRSVGVRGERLFFLS